MGSVESDLFNHIRSNESAEAASAHEAACVEQRAVQMMDSQELVSDFIANAWDDHKSMDALMYALLHAEGENTQKVANMIYAKVYAEAKKEATAEYRKLAA